MPRSASGEDVPLSAILSALILGADHALTLEELRKTLADIEEQRRAQAESGPDVSDDELDRLSSGGHPQSHRRHPHATGGGGPRHRTRGNQWRLPLPDGGTLRTLGAPDAQQGARHGAVASLHRNPRHHRLPAARHAFGNRERARRQCRARHQSAHGDAAGAHRRAQRPAGAAVPLRDDAAISRALRAQESLRSRDSPRRPGRRRGCCHAPATAARALNRALTRRRVRVPK